MFASRLPQDIYCAIVEWCNCGRSFALATVVKAEGSTPCKAGAKAMIDGGGAILGTIGGGAVEAEAQRLAVVALASGRPLVFDFRLEGNVVAEGEPICGGTMRVLVDPTAARHRAEYAAAADARKNRRGGFLLTAFRGMDQSEIVVRFFEENNAPVPCPRQAWACRNSEKTRHAHASVEHGTANTSDFTNDFEVFVEPLIPNPLLVIAGGGHIGQALALQASWVGFDIVVIDDRPEFAEAVLFPEGTIVKCGPIAEEIEKMPFEEGTYVVLVTRGHQHDAAALAAALSKPATYLGMIGSRRKVELMRREFLASGRATVAEFDRVHAPLGLEIGAATVPEIATSIVAQLIAVRRGATMVEKHLQARPS
jgi:xanthine dehydrogenase accessory factor